MRADPELRLASAASAADPERRLLSPLTWRILAVNLTAPVVLVLGLLFLDEYEQTLVAAELDALRTQGEMIAASIGESAIVVETENADFPVFTPSGGVRTVDQASARQLIRRLADLAQLRARLFDRSGAPIADSRLLRGPGGEVQVVDLPPVDDGPVLRNLRNAYDVVATRLGRQPDLEPYVEQPDGNGSAYQEVAGALDSGEIGDAVRRRADGQKILTVAVPVQFYKQMVGAVLVSRDGRNIDQRLFDVRRSILVLFGWVLGLSILTSAYLAGTIGRPLRVLAEAAQRIRHSKNRRSPLPDLSRRRDEIGELSAALGEMTQSLWTRLDAIEQFAADVAHEIKNPLTSLRSAVETVARVKDPEQQKKLMSIILDDVGRLNRLISDISDASRLDAELSRAEMSSVPLIRVLKALAEMQNATDDTAAPRVTVIGPDSDELEVDGLEGRLAQVFRNLIGNAVSFSPPQGRITVRAARGERSVRIDVDDEGPGIPPGKEQAIFDRFYSERPTGEKFGTHSGLGLSISKQIVAAHHGTISAKNRRDDEPGQRGARFTVILPT
ncbi:MAG: HAMP domain-containing protein [Alphaproteobacteria bacterium]|nr:HAMP domain-containing protein [Alphaproteobacteria bacterium]